MRAGSGEPPSCVVRYRIFIVSTGIVLYVGGEVTMRVLWSTSVTEKNNLIALYHIFILVATLACTVSFVILSALLFRLLRGIILQFHKRLISKF
jgi:lysylphosphatidylglycerol synthetase-like protein (DUF2156 family)